MFSWDSRLNFLAKNDPTLFESLVWPPYVGLGVKKNKQKKPANMKSKFENWFVNKVHYIIHI